MGYFDVFMGLTLIETIFDGVKDLATSRETAKWFWMIVVGLIVVLLLALLAVTLFAG